MTLYYAAVRMRIVQTGQLEDATRSEKRVTGLTHLLYRYPARFSPDFPRAAIEQFTKPDDWVLDPFVGGGTTAVEALAAGRHVAAIDINPLAVLLTRAKTTPLYPRDAEVLRAWIDTVHPSPSMDDPRLRNAPGEHVQVLSPLAAAAAALPTPRQRQAARALLVHVGQWALDGRQEPIPATHIKAELRVSLERHLASMREFVDAAAACGLRPSDLTRRLILRQGDASNVARERPWNRLAGRIKLVLTSPPYPVVHVLYHRWQVRGRTETPLAYYLAGLSDGLGASHYTMGGRAQGSEDVYFRSVAASFNAVRRLLKPNAHVVQLVSFNAPEHQLGRYLEAMDEAGFDPITDAAPTTRQVPNRRWYYRVRPERGDAREYLLVHRLRS